MLIGSCLSPVCIAQVTQVYQKRSFIDLKGKYFLRNYICWSFFLRELIFADRGQSAKPAKLRTRPFFMLHDSFFQGEAI